MDNRSHLLECALALFAARGYEAVGVQEIVDTAGVTKPTLYHHFTSKRGLLDALLEKYFSEMNTVLREAADYHHDVPLTLEAVACASFEFARRQPDFYRMQIGMHFSSPDSEPSQAVRRFSMERYTIMEELFRLAALDHGNMKGRQRAYAATFLGMIDTYVGLYINSQVELNDVLVHQAVHQFMHGIFS
jgi:TetR/AcrR family transcriptional regulator